LHEAILNVVFTMYRKRQGMMRRPLVSSKNYFKGLVGYSRRAMRSRRHTLDQGGSVKKYTLEHQSRQRSYALYTPTSYDAEHASPLVLFFHGGYGSADRAYKHSGMNDVAEREGFIVAYTRECFSPLYSFSDLNPSSYPYSLFKLSKA